MIKPKYMKIKYLLLLCITLNLFFVSKAQQNLAFTGVPNHSGGGVTVFGHTNYNDDINAGPSTTEQPWGWVKILRKLFLKHCNTG